MISSLTFAHELTKEQQKQVYNYIKLQLDLERITIKEAQEMWVTQNVLWRIKKGANAPYFFLKDLLWDAVQMGSVVSTVYLIGNLS